MGGRRWTRWALVLVVLAGGLAACGDDDDDAADTTTTTEATTTTQDAAAAEADIKAAFELFFDGSNPDNEAKLAVLENGDDADVQKVFNDLYNNPEFAEASRTVGAQVESVEINGDQADVSYKLINATTKATLLPNALPGTAVLVDGEWKVSTKTFCDIGALGNPNVAQEEACQ
jgi:hypothetical protein